MDDGELAVGGSGVLGEGVVDGCCDGGVSGDDGCALDGDCVDGVVCALSVPPQEIIPMTTARVARKERA